MTSSVVGWLVFVGVVAAAVGALVGWALAQREAERRLALVESRADAFERDAVATAFEVARLGEERHRLEQDQAELHRTMTTLGAELEAQRLATEEAQRARDRASAAATNARDDLDQARARLADLALVPAERDDARAEAVRLEDALRTLQAQFERVAGQGRGGRCGPGWPFRSSHSTANCGARPRRAGRSVSGSEAARALLAAQVLDLQRRLEAAGARSEALAGERNDAVDGEHQARRRLGEVETRLRDQAVEHEQAVAALRADLGAATARADRVEPLRRQLTDREELVRSMAHERDEASRLAGRLEADLELRTREAAERQAEVERLRAATTRLDERVAELEAAEGAAVRARDEEAVARRRAEVQVASLTDEIRARDVRFQRLLDDRREAVLAGREEVGRLREEIARTRAGESRNGTASSAHLNGAADSDDLKLIAGIGPAIERLLHDHGVTTFRQIADWTPAEVARFGDFLGALRGRIDRDRWVEQARERCGTAAD
ncbi:MAG: hypothetical protein R2882_04430 [Gemmatimonadales bacterium]